MRMRTRSPCRHDQRVDAREHAAVPGPQVEIEHGVDARRRAARHHVVGVQQEHEVAVDAMQVRVARMRDPEAHHAHRHLHHLVGVRVVHERARAPRDEFVDEGLARLDLRLVEPADTVHAVRQALAVPVDGRVLGQAVGDEDADLVAFHHLDRRARRLAVVAPQLRDHARGELALDRLGDQVELLPAVLHAKRQAPAIQRDDRTVRPDRRWAAAVARTLRWSGSAARAGLPAPPSRRCGADQRAGAGEKTAS